MEGHKLGNRSVLGERQGPWLTQSLTQSLTESLPHYLYTETAEARAEARQLMFQALQYSGCKGLRAIHSHQSICLIKFCHAH